MKFNVLVLCLSFFLSLSLQAKDYLALGKRCAFVLKGFSTEHHVFDEHTELHYSAPTEIKTNRHLRWYAFPVKGKTYTLKPLVRTEVILPDELVPGDTLKYPDGSSFRLFGYYGSGGNVDVFRVEEGGQTLTLRSPKYEEHETDEFHLKNNAEFLAGVKTYNKLGVRTVEVVRHAQDKSWALVKPVDKKFELTQLLIPGQRKIIELLFSKAEVAKAANAYLQFLESMRNFVVAEDFASFQIVWDGKEWVCLDPSDPVVVLTDEMLMKHPAMILKSPFTPEMDENSYNQTIKYRLKHLRKDFPRAYSIVRKFLKDNKDGSPDEVLNVEVDLSDFDAEIRSL